MREVSSAAAYNATQPRPPRMAVRRMPESHETSHYTSFDSPTASLHSSPHKSPSPTRPLLASHSSSFVTTPNRYQNPASRLSQSVTAAPPPPPPAYDRAYNRPTDPFNAYSENMSGHDRRWDQVAPNDHDYYDIPTPPTHYHNHANYGQQDPYYQNTQYSGHSNNYEPEYHHDEYLHDGSASSRENPFNRHSYYESSPYPDQSPSPARHSRVDFDQIDPHSIVDGDDPNEYRGAKVGGAAAAGGAAGAFASAAKGHNSQALGDGREKSAWIDADVRSQQKRKRFLWILIAIVTVLVIAGAAAGAVIGIRKSSKSSSGSSSSSSSSGSGENDLTISSSQIKSLMNNANLHKVFPVMDYTPYNTQYPGCLVYPPSQDNVTMDMAVLSQLTPNVRVYGTDCSQVEMILTAIDRLNMNDTMKVWLGVWVDNNSTTTNRQLDQMYDILKKYPQDHFKGVIVGNEALFRKDVTETQLADLLSGVRTNFTNMGIKLSVSTSDLGSSWTTSLAAASDHVMGNIHPFFAGVTADSAAGWTWDFWQNNDVAVAPEPTNAAAGSIPRNIISETGWPSGGGNDCGTDNACTSSTVGSVAGITQMNNFMNDWVCQANANGTMYFWFEAFDEPWKVIYNTATEQWEDKWGLMGIDRKLKSGITIPSCGGKTVS